MFTPNFSTKPLWQVNYGATASTPDRFPTKADVVIVGSGYTGGSAALTLAEGGASVVLLEAEELGHGASTRNFGYALGPENRGRYAGRYSDAETDRILAAYAGAGDYLRKLIECSGPDSVGMETQGQLVLAHSPNAAAQMTQNTAPGLDTTLYSSQALPEVIGSSVFHGGVLSRKAVALDPGKTHAALINLAKQAGVQVFDECPAVDVQKEAVGFLIRTPRGTIRARDVALATNGHSGPLNPFLRRRILPVPGTVIATEPLSRDLATSLLPGRHWCVDTQFGFRCFRLSPDGRRVVFAKAGLPGSFSKDIRPYAKRVRDELITVFPQLQDTRLDHAWPASVGVTFDALPHLGQDNGIWFAGGFNGHGVAMSHYLGHMMARRILGDTQNRLIMEDKPFATSVFYHGSTWFMPLLRQVIKLKGLRS